MIVPARFERSSLPDLERLAREGVVERERVRVEEVQLGLDLVDAEDEELHLERPELAGNVVAMRELLERRAVGHLPGTLGDRQLDSCR